MMDTSSPPEVLGVPPRPQKPKKRSRSEHKAALNTDIAKLRDQISAHKKKCQGEIRDIYRENLAELFFLQHGLNLIDFPQWRKKPNQLLASYLQNYALEEEEPVSRSTVKDEPTAQTPPPAITHPPPSQR